MVASSRELESLAVPHAVALEDAWAAAATPPRSSAADCGGHLGGGGPGGCHRPRGGRCRSTDSASHKQVDRAGASAVEAGTVAPPHPERHRRLCAVFKILPHYVAIYYDLRGSPPGRLPGS